MAMFVNVEVKRRKAKMKRNIKAPCKSYVSIKFCSISTRLERIDTKFQMVSWEKKNLPAHEPHL